MRNPFDRIDRTVSDIPAARTAQLRGASVASILGREPEERGLLLLQEAKPLAPGLQVAASSESTSWLLQSGSKLPRGDGNHFEALLKLLNTPQCLSRSCRPWTWP